jgi:kynureninase
MKVTDRAYALELDKNDPLADYRSKFVITDPNLCYLDGNSLGRLPHATVKAVSDFLSQEWGNEVVICVMPPAPNNCLSRNNKDD